MAIAGHHVEVGRTRPRFSTHRLGELLRRLGRRRDLSEKKAMALALEAQKWARQQQR
jgi:hypothetical protein